MSETRRVERGRSAGYAGLWPALLSEDASFRSPAGRRPAYPALRLPLARPVSRKRCGFHATRPVSIQGLLGSLTRLASSEDLEAKTGGVEWKLPGNWPRGVEASWKLAAWSGSFLETGRVERKPQRWVRWPPAGMTSKITSSRNRRAGQRPAYPALPPPLHAAPCFREICAPPHLIPRQPPETKFTTCTSPICLQPETTA